MSVAKQSRRQPSTLPLLAPSVTVLFAWMVVPLSMTLWFSLQRYSLLDPSRRGFVGVANYRYLLGDPTLWTAMFNTLVLVSSVLVITVVLGTLLAVMLDQQFPGRRDRESRLHGHVDLAHPCLDCSSLCRKFRWRFHWRP